MTVEAKHGLYNTETQKLTRGMEKLALEPMGDAAVYDLVRDTQDTMVEDALLQQQEQFRVKNEAILALIDAVRRKERR
ncbi:hypothetical protein DD238_008390 [Peronospora effusa]|uniref:Uncharacterized protein n=1 Tax=Peronospora effusa TaxID=542832 RepID=A0A3M6V6L4_9STRA|nr:hypothetical protein DD238_008390 [Peronospora effusa]